MKSGRPAWPTYLESAQETVRRECQQIERECLAFQRFRQRVHDFETATPQIGPLSVGMHQGFTCSQRSVRDRVEPWYRETVMAVDHYDDVYEDSFTTSFSAEFGTDVLHMISDASTFSSGIEGRLLNVAQQCIDSRQRFVDMLEDESATLSDAESNVRKIQHTIDKIDDEDGRCLSTAHVTSRFEALQSLNDECEEWLQRRQDQIRGRRFDRSSGASGGTDLCSYLYESLNVNHPILATFVDVMEIICRNEPRLRRRVD